MSLATILFVISLGIGFGYYFYCVLEFSPLHTILAVALIAVLMLKIGY